MKKKYNYLLFLSIVLLSACSTSLDVTGDYKETMVVYGLLDQSQAKQYIKVNKAFLGQGNAVTYAGLKDSAQYANALTVTLKRSDGQVFNLLPDNTIPKDPGVFYGPDQTNVIYSFVSQPNSTTNYLPAASSYSLTIRNGEAGTEVSGQTSLITSVGAFVQPIPSTSTNPTFNFADINNPNVRFKIEWHSGKNAKMYQATIRFNYIDSTITGAIYRYLDWQFPVQTTSNLSGGEDMLIDFIGADYLQYIGNQLSGQPTPIYRRALKTEILLTAGSDDLNTFIAVNAPSTGIVQEKPKFTNINNGLGIFSSRYNEPSFSRNLNGKTLNALACGQYTRSLRFLNAQGIICP